MKGSTITTFLVLLILAIVLAGCVAATPQEEPDEPSTAGQTTVLSKVYLPTQGSYRLGVVWDDGGEYANGMAMVAVDRETYFAAEVGQVVFFCSRGLGYNPALSVTPMTCNAGSY